jgi:hypothetical protein
VVNTQARYLDTWRMRLLSEGATIALKHEENLMADEAQKTGFWTQLAESFSGAIESIEVGQTPMTAGPPGLIRVTQSQILVPSGLPMDALTVAMRRLSPLSMQ